MAIDRSWYREQVRAFEAARPLYQHFAALVNRALEAETRRLGMPDAIVQSRAKTIPSFAEKAIRKRHKYVDPVHQLTDLCGARVITVTPDDIPPLCDFIRATFAVDEANSEDVGGRLRDQEFGYRSVHFVVSLRRDVPLAEASGELYAHWTEEDAERSGGRLCGPRHKCEIQVRTLLQHAWAAVVHDSLYKNDFRPPQRLFRATGRVAALLEDADDSFATVLRELERYRTQYGAYMSSERLREELEILQTVRAFDPGNAKLAVRIGGIASTLGDWSVAREVLEPFAADGHAAALRELGIARTGAGEDGRGALDAALRATPRDVDARCALAEAWRDASPDEALGHYHAAWRVDPTEPRAVAGYVTLRLQRERDAAFLDLMRPSLEAAAARCEEREELGVALPDALYQRALLQMLLGAHHDGLETLTQAIRLSVTETPIAAALGTYRGLDDAVGAAVVGLRWARRTLSVALLARRYEADRAAAEALAAARALGEPDEATSTRAESTREALERLRRELGAGHTPTWAVDELGAGPVLYVAGDGSDRSESQGFHWLMRSGLVRFRGAIFAGGTRSGVSGVVGDLPVPSDGGLVRIGYVPRTDPEGVTLHPAYRMERSDGDGFSVLEALAAWQDLLAAGIPPWRVAILGLGGGPIARLEYALGVCLGARVGLVADSGRAATAVAADPRYAGRTNIARLPADPASLAAFLRYDAPSGLPREAREAMARAAHEAYREKQRARFASTDPSMSEWERLPADLRESNRRQTEDMEHCLRSVGLSATPAPAGVTPACFALTDAQVERMAEHEHGRWNVERLLAGWRPGPRDPQRRTTPYLVSWKQLPEEVREWDRQAVREFPATLARFGYEVRPTGAPGA